MTWFKRGVEGLKEKERIDAELELRREKYAPRFWLKENEEAKVIFLDSEAFYCYVHQLKIGNSWDNHITCTNEFKPCPICEDGKRATYIGHYSIIDLRSYTKKDGTVVKYTKKLFPAKSSAIMKLHDLAKKYGSLTGLLIKVKRYKDEPNCGGSFEVLGKPKNLKSKFKPEDLKPFDYEKVLAPPTDDELKKLGYVVSDNVFGSDAQDVKDLEVEELDQEVGEIEV